MTWEGGALIVCVCLFIAGYAIWIGRVLKRKVDLQTTGDAYGSWYETKYKPFPRRPGYAIWIERDDGTQYPSVSAGKNENLLPGERVTHWAVIYPPRAK